MKTTAHLVTHSFCAITQSYYTHIKSLLITIIIPHINILSQALHMSTCGCKQPDTLIIRVYILVSTQIQANCLLKIEICNSYNRNCRQIEHSWLLMPCKKHGNYSYMYYINSGTYMVFVAQSTNRL